MPVYWLPGVAKKPEKSFATSKGASEPVCKETMRPGVKSLPETVMKHDLLPRELWVPVPTPASLAMYWMKMCPRCRGDLYQEETRFGQYVACLQCGRSLDARLKKPWASTALSSPFPFGNTLQERPSHRSTWPEGDSDF